jgi:protein FAM50
MSNTPPSRFTSSNKTTHERLTTNTVGLVALSDFRKRRAEVLEQQEREAREAALAVTNATPAPDRSNNATPSNASDQGEAEKQVKRKKKKPRTKAPLSFGDDEGSEDDGDNNTGVSRGDKKRRVHDTESELETEAGMIKKADPKVVNSSVAIVPRALTKAALRREAAEREALRKQFLLLQAAVKATDIAIPFVFYDGTNIPGGIVRVKKGDFIWVFLDKSRKVGADLGVGGEKTANVRREWARVGVDDLMLVRGTIILPHVSFI